MSTSRGIAVAAMILFVVGGYVIVGRIIRSADRLNAAHRQAQPIQAVLASDPKELLAASRRLLAARRGTAAEIDVADAVVPEVLRSLRPTKTRFIGDSIAISFGEPVTDFGIIAFPPGVTGNGDQKWIDGLWLFDRQKLLNNGEPSAGGNRGQRPRSDLGRSARGA